MYLNVQIECHTKSLNNEIHLIVLGEILLAFNTI